MTVAEQEEEILQFWQKNRIYDKVKKMKKVKRFYFLDGPPYATGNIHMGTAMNKILKDFYIRFFRMQGFNVWDQPGYDTHGVPIENKVEQKLGFRTKQDIEKFGVERFIKECKQFATEFIDVMDKQFANLGVWMNWKKPYLTLSNDYIEGAWFTFKKAFEKSFLYKGSYSVHVCPHCETAVAYNEIEYNKVTDPSIYVRFKLRDADEYLVVWTTTPWTLPSNTGVMVKPDAEYVKVEVAGEVLILAKGLLESVMSKMGVKDYKIIETMKGKELEGLKYHAPFEELPYQQNLKNAHRVVLSNQFVSLEDGTGLVHIAPGHGQEDYKVGVENGLPVINPLSLNGRFNKDSRQFAGMFAKDADKVVIQELKRKNLLLWEETVTHDYPFCWRCKNPLLMMAVPQWFFKVTAIRDDLLKENRKINWLPSWAGQRFQNWLENLGDWPISRQRYWGTPLPIWVCDKCEHVQVIGSRGELPRVPKDFHKPYIDQVTWPCKKCKRGTMRRVPDVMDVWFDAGVASWASLGYPREKKLFKEMWPADFILEGPDQIRGWWNSLMITSMMTFDKAPFENVLFHGFVLDAHGTKMSKSLGNVVSPEEVVKKYGRDVLRFYFLSGAPWDDYFFKWEDVEELAKSFVVLRNTFNFVKTYVNSSGKPRNLKREDKWLLSRLNSLIQNSTEHCQTFNGHKAAKEILDFILNDLSRWYIKLVRDRAWPTYSGSDKQAAFYTLFTAVETLSRLLAPFTPFFAEDVYKTILKPLHGKLESIHMYDWPKANKKLIDKNLERNMIVIKEIVEASLAARQNANIKLRWPIKRIVVVSKSKPVANAAKQLKDTLLQMCNCKSVEILEKQPSGEFYSMSFDGATVSIDKKLDKKLLGEAMMRELVREIQSIRKTNKFNVKESILMTLKSDEESEKVLSEHKDEIKKEVGARKLLIGKLKGKHKGSIEFEGKKVEVAFDRA